MMLDLVFHGHPLVNRVAEVDMLYTVKLSQKKSSSMVGFLAADLSIKVRESDYIAPENI